MITLSEHPMNLIEIEFEELYQRHLCRHSQFVVNVIHLVTLCGIWYSFSGILYCLIPLPWLITLGASGFIMTALNMPARLSLLTALLMVVLALALYAVPLPWIWGYLILVPLFYKIQTMSHQIGGIEHDMAPFRQKYPPGAKLYSILMLYELPIVINYLFFRRQDWQ